MKYCIVLSREMEAQLVPDQAPSTVLLKR